MSVLTTQQGTPVSDDHNSHQRPRSFSKGGRKDTGVRTVFDRCGSKGPADLASDVPFFDKAGVAAEMDDGLVLPTTSKGPSRFLAGCRKLRKWEREKVVTVWSN